MGDRRSSLSRSIQMGIDSALKELHTCLPAEVISFNAADQTADLQPSIKRKFLIEKDGEATEEMVLLPVLKSVPIRYQRSSSYSITFPLGVGDHVMVIFCERSIDTWMEQGGIKEPSDVRKHDLSDAFALPMMYPKPDVITSFNPDDLEIKTNSGNAKIIVKASGEVHIETDSESHITSSKTTIHNDLLVTGAITGQTGIAVTGNHPDLPSGSQFTGDLKVVSGDVVADTISLKTHKTSQVQPGTGTSGVPVP